MARRILALSLVLTLAATLAVSLSAGSDAPRRHSAVVPAAEPVDTTDARKLGRTDGRELVDFTLTLRLADARLDRFLAAQQDPRSPGFGRGLDPRAFGERFGPDKSELTGLRRALLDAGMEITRSYPQRTNLRVRGSASEVNRLFDVALHDFAAPSGARWHAPSERPTVPAALRGAVRGVTGLDTRPLPALSAAVPEEGLAAESLGLAYNIAPLHEQGIDGEGQTIAIMGYEAFDEADVAEYDEVTGTEGPPVERVNVDGGVNQPGSGEIHLDIDVVRAVAPKAQILSYEGPNGPSLAPVIDQIVADGRTDIVSLSWGRCDIPEAFAPGVRDADLQAFKAAAAAGISVFVASGDAGAYDCQHADINLDLVSVDFPSASPDVISVGGTRLSVRENGSYLEEAGWEDVLSAGGGGGGLSTVEDRPDWQRGPGVDNEFSTGKRQIPDVAAPADPDSGYLVVDEGETTASGGTSGAAPFWAASMLLVRQYVADKGGPDGLGYVNPMLYRIAAEEGRVSPFNDVVRGGNRLHNATPGWDYATGLGSPDVFELAQAFAQRLAE
jgi:subtilase family serine protease